MLTYFTEDGTFGSNDIVLLVTDEWTQAEWQEIEECADSDRLDLALDIDKRHSK